MKSERPLSSRFSIALVLSMVCLPHTACSHSKPAMDKTQHDRAVAQAQELRTSAEAGDASAQYRLGLASAVILPRSQYTDSLASSRLGSASSTALIVLERCLSSSSTPARRRRAASLSDFQALVER